MGALPKERVSKSRRDRRRAHDHLTAPALVACINCGMARLPHHVCPNCGQYKGRQVLEDKTKKKTT